MSQSRFIRRASLPTRRTIRRVVTAALALTVVAVLPGCSGDGDKPKAAVPVAKTVGEGEGSLNLVAWSGYAENGSTDPAVDWVQPFEKRTRCRVAVKYASSTSQMVELLSAGGRRYDGVTAPPEVAWQLMAKGHVAPINPKLVEGFEDIDSRLREPLKQGKQYFGMPFTWGANVLMYDPKAVDPAPTSWGAVFDPAEAKKHAGQVIVRDSPLTIADAALYLREDDRSLAVKDPFELNEKQLRAASSLLARQRAYVKAYWNHPSEAIGAFAGEGAVLGQVWPYHVDVLSRAQRSVMGVTPEGGSTGWVDAWMIGARAENRNCMYQWLNWVNSPDVQQSVAEWTGVAPANPEACEGDRLRRQFCDAHHVGDRQFLSKVEFAHPPPQKCSPGKCTSFAEWSRAWQAARR